jgi:hypothetical protein
MRRKRGFALSLSVVLCPFISSLAGSFTVPKQLTDSCVFLMQGEKTMGTGFLLGVQDSNSTVAYLVTAKHVAKPLLSTQNMLAVRFNVKDSNEARTVAFPIKYRHNGKRWLEHSNPAVDLAIVLLPIFSEIQGLDVVLLPINGPDADLLATATWLKKYKVGPGDRAFTLGLVPFLYAPTQQNLVLARFGAVSLLPAHEINLHDGRQKAYFIDCQAFGGNSGGPAFVLIQRSEKGPLLIGWRCGLLGVVTEFVPSPLRAGKLRLGDSEPNKVKSGADEVTVPVENTGISKVVPVDYLVEILFSEEQKQFRKRLLEITRTIERPVETKPQSNQ